VIIAAIAFRLPENCPGGPVARPSGTGCNRFALASETGPSKNFHALTGRLPC